MLNPKAKKERASKKRMSEAPSGPASAHTQRTDEIHALSDDDLDPAVGGVGATRLQIPDKKGIRTSVNVKINAVTGISNCVKSKS